MNRFAVVVAPSAMRQAHAVVDWWRAHRVATPDLFDAEFEAVLGRLSLSPVTGSKYRESKGRVVRRLLMPRTPYHVYFEIDEEKGRVGRRGGLARSARKRATSLTRAGYRVRPFVR